jgi:ferredoxin--NADP+ reductase
MGELDNVDVVVHSENLVLATAAGASPHVRRNLALMADWAGRIPQGRPRRLHVHFQKRPIEILGEDKVRGLRLEDTVVDAGVGGGTADLSVDMVVRAVGYRSVLPSGLPVDERTHTIPTRDHRVLRGGTTSAGEYAVGWMKRGPTGILGTNRRDAADTVEALLQDAAALIAARDGQPQRLDALMDQRGVRYVDVPRWLAIADAEGRHGSVHGRGRVKISEWDGLLFAAGLERSTNGPKIGRDRLPTGWGA